MSDKSPDHTEHYEGLSAAGIKKGSESDAHKGHPSEAEDKRGGQTKD